MKKLLLICSITILGILNCYSQDIIKFRTTDASMRIRDITDQWNPWIASSSGEGILITVDTDNSKKIKVYGKQTMELSIISLSTDESRLSEGIKMYKFDCIGQDGQQCMASIIYYNNQTSRDLIVLFKRSQMKFGLKSD